jgi:hypothetical protein
MAMYVMGLIRRAIVSCQVETSHNQQHHLLVAAPTDQ